MILVDTSVWVDHLRAADDRLTSLLNDRRVLMHPFVIGEIALGTLRRRQSVIVDLQGMPQATVAEEREVLTFIDRHQLAGRGIGYVDAHLLAAAKLTRASLWTRDNRLQHAAHQLGLKPPLLH